MNAAAEPSKVDGCAVIPDVLVTDEIDRVAIRLDGGAFVSLVAVRDGH